MTLPVMGANHIDWARLLPVDLKSEEMEAVLHRSHHAMAYGGTLPLVDTAAGSTSSNAGGVLVHWYILWAGFDADMGLKQDAWIVYIYPAGACVALSRNEWWQRAWCWAAKRAVQSGSVPGGRAYAQMAYLQVRSTHNWWQRCMCRRMTVAGRRFMCRSCCAACLFCCRSVLLTLWERCHTTRCNMCPCTLPS